MSTSNWHKVENEAGYPLYIDNATGRQQYDHPEFNNIMKCVEDYDGIKYSAYRIALKTFALQTELKVPPLRISSGVFARHQLSLSESSLSLDTAALESVLCDIYFAAEQEGYFNGDVDQVVDLVINLLLNVYDKERTEPIRVLAAKTVLFCLSEDTVADKWMALASCCADHNSCVSPKRLASLLTHVNALAQFLGSSTDMLQSDVDACFEKSAGMLGISASSVAEWGAANCKSAQWLGVVTRVIASRQCINDGISCSCCTLPIAQMLKFQCTKCGEVYFCEKCYLYDKISISARGHKKDHIINEICDAQPKPTRNSLMKTMKRFFFCTKTSKRKTSKGTIVLKKTDKRRNRPDVYTSTVGKVSGKKDNPAVVLQDIIAQLETQSRNLKDLTEQIEKLTKCNDEGLQAKLVLHWSEISTQINRLKSLNENLTKPAPDKSERPPMFDLFSPITDDDKQSKLTEKIKPRVLSLDSGIVISASKSCSQNLLTVSGDTWKPVVTHPTSDSISHVSINDISSWYNVTDQPDQQTTSNKRSVVKPSQQNGTRQYTANTLSGPSSNIPAPEQQVELDAVLDRLQKILANNFDESCDNTQLRETASEMEGLIGTLIRGVEQRATLNATKGLV